MSYIYAHWKTNHVEKRSNALISMDFKQMQFIRVLIDLHH